MFDLDSKPEHVTKWFSWPEFPGEEYLLRHVFSSEVSAYNEEDALDVILLDWKGIGKAGESSECNEKNKRAFIRSKGGRERFLKMFFVARRIDLFYDVAEVAKNSWRSQSGSIPSAALMSEHAENANHRAEV